MPRFCNECSSDMFICQECASDLCSRGCGQKLKPGMEAAIWIEGKGNVCMTCISKFYLRTPNGYIKVVSVKPKIQLKGNPAYDLMM